jgi:arylsulfatase A-like enzyme
MPPKSVQPPVNVVWIVSDQHRRDACGCFGSRVRRRDGTSPTPHIDALAARGAAFSRAICASPLCAPSRASYLTGLYPHTTTALHHKMLEREAGLSRFPGVREGVRTVADHFRAAGHRTAAIGKVHVHGEEANGWDLGFDVRELRFYTQAPGMHYGDLAEGDTNRRYRQLPPYEKMTYWEVDPARFVSAPADLTVGRNTLNAHRLETLVEREEEMFDYLVADRSMAFVDQCVSCNQPFFIHVGFEKPHEPWSVPQRFLDLFDPASMPPPTAFNDWREKGWFPGILRWQHHDATPEEARNIMAAYYACVAALDDQVGRVVNRCAELGILDRTVFIYASDHGELLFDHGLIYKHNFFEASVGVPLVLAGPGIPVGVVSEGSASLLDLLPTTLELAGLDASLAAEGVSLVPACFGDGISARILFSEFHQSPSAAWGHRMHPTRMALAGDFKYIYTHGLRDQLFDLGNDPEEVDDVAAEPEKAEILAKLRHACLRDWELDAHPQLWLRGCRRGGLVTLEWESVGKGASYEVWREPEGAAAFRVASELQATEWVVPEDQGPHRYRVIASPALVHPFVDETGLARYGAQPVQTEEYPSVLPVSPLLVLSAGKAAAEVDYQPWHGLIFAGRKWIYEGMPPTVREAYLQGVGPVAILSARPHAGDLRMEGTVLEVEGAYGEGDNSGESSVTLVFAWLSQSAYHGVAVGADGGLELFRQQGATRQVLGRGRLPKEGGMGPLSLSLTGLTVDLTLGGRSLIRWTSPEPIPAGRFGYTAGLRVRHYRVG